MTHPEGPLVSAVIVNWNTAELLRDCIRSFQRCYDLPVEIIVVDNASSDSSVEMVKREFPSCIVLANDANHGYASACNQGIRQSRGQYILVLNSDTVLHEGSIEALTATLETEPRAGLAAPALVTSEGGLQRSCWRGFPSLWFALADALYLWKLSRYVPFLARDEVQAHRVTTPTAVDHVLGACMLVRRQAIADAGCLDEAYFMFLEETDWCFRLQKAGHLTYYVPQARVTHIGGQSTRQIPGRMLPQSYRSYCRFCRKNLGFGPAKVAALKTVFSLAAMIRILLWGSRALLSREALPRRMVRGYARVLAELASM